MKDHLILLMGPKGPSSWENDPSLCWLWTGTAPVGGWVQFGLNRVWKLQRPTHLKCFLEVHHEQHLSGEMLTRRSPDYRLALLELMVLAQYRTTKRKQTQNDVLMHSLLLFLPPSLTWWETHASLDWSLELRLERWFNTLELKWW